MLLVKMSLDDFIRKFRTAHNASAWLDDEPLTKLYYTLESMPPITLATIESHLIGGCKVHHFSNMFPDQVDKIAMKDGSLKDLYALLVEESVGMIFTNDEITEMVVLT